MTHPAKAKIDVTLGRVHSARHLERKSLELEYQHDVEIEMQRGRGDLAVRQFELVIRGEPGDVLAAQNSFMHWVEGIKRHQETLRVPTRREKREAERRTALVDALASYVANPKVQEAWERVVRGRVLRAVKDPDAAFKLMKAMSTRQGFEAVARVYRYPGFDKLVLNGPPRESRLFYESADAYVATYLRRKDLGWWGRTFGGRNHLSVSDTEAIIAELSAS